ncbi:IclR family transcriptional regulator [Granulosicoccus sp. 3-233]|uniref:IclR family transcriptional regulator n=1 Tax=Granulosicoccus sp. 3-233 TaxID=3417969 RepID=UPI003D351749
MIKTSSSAERTLRVLQYLAERSQPVPLAELSGELDLPKPTVHRLCQLLLDLRMIKHDVEEKTYLIGPALQKLAMDTLTHGTVSQLRHSVLADLVDTVGETCNFTTLNGSSVLYLDRVETRYPWRLTIDVGESVPIHCTASGKLFLAMMHSVKRNYLLRRLELARLTDQTMTDLDQLRESLEEVRQVGYALDQQEFITGLIAIAVPVHDSQGEPRAAVAIHGPTSRICLQDLHDMLPDLKKAAARMTELL